MDRISRAEVGGPYASHDDALRAIQNKGFDADPADLTVQEGSADDGDDGTSKESSLKRAAADPMTAQQPRSVTSPNPTTQQVTPDAERDDPSSLPGAPEDGQKPGAMSGPLAKTTKPSQTPSGGGGGMPGPGGEDGDDVSGDENPQDPESQQYDANDGGGSDPIGGAIASIAAQVIRDNPDLFLDHARRVARKVVGKLVQANGLMPHIEDPLANKTPLDVVNDVRKTLPKGSPAAAPSHEDERDEHHGDPAHPLGDHPDDEDDDDSSLPGHMPMGFQRGPRGNLLAATPEAGVGAEAAGVGAAAEGAGAEAAGAAGAEGLGAGLGELAPLLLV